MEGTFKAKLCLEKPKEEHITGSWRKLVECILDDKFDRSGAREKGSGYKCVLLHRTLCSLPPVALGDKTPSSEFSGTCTHMYITPRELTMHTNSIANVIVEVYRFGDGNSVIS